MFHYASQKFIPIVIKDYSTLVGYCEAIDFVRASYRNAFNTNNYDIIKNNTLIYHNSISALSSFRFNSICFLGLNIDETKLDELESYLTEHYKEYLEFKQQIPIDEKTLPIWSENILSIDCPHCGMNHAFNDSEDIPKKDFYCTVCEEILIDYTDKHDYEFSYLGNDKRRLAFQVLEEKVIRSVVDKF